MMANEELLPFFRMTSEDYEKVRKMRSKKARILSQLWEKTKQHAYQLGDVTGIRLGLDFLVVDLKAGRIDAFFTKEIQMNFGLFGECRNIVVVEGPRLPRKPEQ